MYKERVPIRSGLQNLESILREMKHVMVAYSGGVDSTLLLKAARDTLGEKVLAVTALSDTMPGHEREDAIRIAKLLEVNHILLESHELEIDEFVANPPNKCYICKKYRFGKLVTLARQKGIPYVLDGENTDDQQDFRPGIDAARELGIRSPLKEAGLSKSDIRQLSKQLDLPTWNKPSAACLASRIPYYQPITSQKLKQIDKGEQFIRRLGISDQVRIRHHGDVARLEVDTDHIIKFSEKMVRDCIVEQLQSLGFNHITLDLEGYSTGRLNRSLNLEQKENK